MIFADCEFVFVLLSPKIVRSKSVLNASHCLLFVPAGVFIFYVTQFRVCLVLLQFSIVFLYLSAAVLCDAGFWSRAANTPNYVLCRLSSSLVDLVITFSFWDGITWFA